METNFQLLLQSPNLLKSKVPISRGGGGGTNFQLLMLSPNLLKSKIPIFGEGGHGHQFPTFVAESKFAKIQLSHFRGGAVMETNFQLLLQSPNLLKSKVPIFGGEGTHGNQFPTFDA